MTEQKVKVSNGKEYIVKEVLYKDVVGTISEDKTQSAKTLLKLSTGITDEEYDTLSMKDGILLQKALNEVNGLTEGFLQQVPLEKV